jgi:stalled ribosome alternative rescue factor ArfA
LTNNPSCAIINTEKNERKKKMKNKEMFKKDKEELQQYLRFRKRGFVIKNRKGKGSYDRRTSKRINEE